MTEPPAEGFKRWSDWRTWGASAKVRGVPGTGARRWADVMIPILDDPSLPKIHVRAAYIMVFGRLTAGEPSAHFSSRVTFTLYQNFKQQRAPYALQFHKPADPGNPRDLGHKTFAVVGGQVSLYGMPGGGNTPSWVRLTETADAGARAIYVNADVTRWAAGMTIALASTSADLNDADHHVIASVSVVTPVSGPGKSDGRYKINLKTALKKRHDGVKISDGLLDRGQPIYASFWIEANPYMRGLSKLLPTIGSTVPFRYNWGTWDGNQAHSNLFGFRTYPHGSKPKYPSPTRNPRVSLKNFLVYRNKAGIFFFNSERLIVENGVFLDNGIGIDLSRNAGVQAKGCRFIGRSSSACPSSNAGTTTTALATSSSSGTITTTQDTSNGPDASIPPESSSPDNSTTAAAPIPPAEPLPGNDTTAATDPNAPENSTLPGNDSTGGGAAAAPNDQDSPVPAGPTTLWQPFTLQASLGPLDPFADDGSADSSGGSGGGGSGGSTSSSNKAFEDAGMADPMGGPSLQEQPGTFAAPIGITLSQSNPQDNLHPNSIQDTSTPRKTYSLLYSLQGAAVVVSFHRFGTCSSSSFGVALVANKAGGYWNTAMFVKGLTFTSGTNKFWATPNPSSGTPPRGGLVARFYAIRDVDGSLLGQSGYAVANYDPILPPAAVRAAKCNFKSAFSAYSCTSVCFRSVGLEYDEYGATSSRTGCSGSLHVVIDSPDSQSKWLANVPTVPCADVNETRVYKEYACGAGKARLRLDVGASSSGKAAVVMELDQGVSTACSSDSGCSTITSAALPPLSIAPLADSESAFSSTDPFFDPSFYAGGADDPHTVL
ncbi:unnamed protein product [Closterium sp. Naga37s-1]|nr:unnamed protein product [Closterium sp. Naga37s-1]